MGDFKSAFSYDSKLMTILNNLADLIFVNLLFIICCIPIVTIGAARAALHKVASMWMEKDQAGGREFMKAFWENLRQATLPWLVMLAFGLLLAFQAVVLTTYTIPGQILVWAIFYLILFVYLLTLVHVTHIPARFESTLKQNLRSAVLIGLGNLIPTLLCAVLGALPFVLFYKWTSYFMEWGLIWLFGFFSLEAAAEAWLLKKTYARLIAQVSGNGEATEEAQETAATEE